VDNTPFLLYLRRILMPRPVDKNVDKSLSLVEKLWITRHLSTARSCPHNFPQVYPQFLPLLSTGLSTDRIAIRSYRVLKYGISDTFIHSFGGLSTQSVDKSALLGTEIRHLSTGFGLVVDGVWTSFDLYASQTLQSRYPLGEG